MKRRPEKPVADMWPRGASSASYGPSPLGTVGLIQHFAGSTEIFRYGDEPGVWRDKAGRIISDAEARRIVPDLANELEQRALLDDRERVAGEVRRIIEGGASEVIAERGEYSLVSVQSGGLVEIHRNGVNIHPAALPEPMARRILDTLSPPDVDLAPADVPLDQAISA